MGHADPSPLAVGLPLRALPSDRPSRGNAQDGRSAKLPTACRTLLITTRSRRTGNVRCLSKGIRRLSFATRRLNPRSSTLQCPQLRPRPFARPSSAPKLRQQHRHQQPIGLRVRQHHSPPRKLRGPWLGPTLFQILASLRHHPPRLVSKLRTSAGGEVVVTQRCHTMFRLLLRAFLQSLGTPSLEPCVPRTCPPCDSPSQTPSLACVTPRGRPLESSDRGRGVDLAGGPSPRTLSHGQLSSLEVLQLSGQPPRSLDQHRQLQQHLLTRSQPGAVPRRPESTHMCAKDVMPACWLQMIPSPTSLQSIAPWPTCGTCWQLAQRHLLTGRLGRATLRPLRSLTRPQWQLPLQRLLRQCQVEHQ